MLGFEVYLGNYAETTDNSALHVVDMLINKADLIHFKGIILYCDNWYTTIRLAKYLYETYRWLFVGTVVANEPKNRNENSVPFKKAVIWCFEESKQGVDEKGYFTRER